MAAVENELLIRLQDIEGLDDLCTSLDSVLDSETAEFFKSSFILDDDGGDDEDFGFEEESEPKKEALPPVVENKSKKRVAAADLDRECPEKNPRVAEPLVFASPGAPHFAQPNLNYLLDLLSSNECRDRATRTPAQDALLFNYAASVANEIKAAQPRRVVLSREDDERSVFL